MKTLGQVAYEAHFRQTIKLTGVEPVWHSLPESLKWAWQETALAVVTADAERNIRHGRPRNAHVSGTKSS